MSVTRTTVRLAGLLAAAAVASIFAGSPRFTFLAGIEQHFLSSRLDPAFLGDGGRALDLLICNPMGLAIDRGGELLVSDRGRGRKGRVVWRIGADGVAHIFAGTGLIGDATASSALKMSFERPEGMAVAPDGSVYLSDGFNHVVFRIAPDGLATRVAGTGVKGYSGDGGPALCADFNSPEGLFETDDGRLFIGDELNHAIRVMDRDGLVFPVMGTGAPGRANLEASARGAPLNDPENVLVTPAGDVIITDGDNGRVLRITPDGNVHALAGRGVIDVCGDRW